MPRARPEDVQRTHAVDTLGALARDVAHPVATFYRACRENEGLDRDDARALAGEFLRLLLSHLSPTRDSA
jgi:hypothetical protein